MNIRVPTSLEVRACVWVLRVAWWARVFSFDDLIERLEEVRPGAAGRRVDTMASAVKVVAAVRRVQRRLPLRWTCLTESLAALGLLRSLGCPALLRIGVMAAEAPVEAHAWLELYGEPLDRTASDYKALRLPGRAAV